MAHKAESTTTPTLPAVGMSGFKQIQPFINLSRESWRKLVRAHRAPAPIVLSPTCVRYRNEELHKFLADPLNYRAEVQS